MGSCFELQRNLFANCTQRLIGPPCHCRPQISYGRYVAYEAHPSDAESLGQPLKDYATLRPALTACTADVTCIGLKSAPAGAWRTFAGTQWEGVTGKVRVVGESIDVWVTATTST